MPLSMRDSIAQILMAGQRGGGIPRQQFRGAGGLRFPGLAPGATTGPGWGGGGMPSAPMPSPGGGGQPAAAPGVSGPGWGGGSGAPAAMPMPNPGGTAPGQEYWGAGGMGNPNMRVPSTAGMTGNNWSLANQGYFAPMGGPDYSAGVGEGGKPIIKPGAAAAPGWGGGMPPPAPMPGRSI